MRLNDPQCGTMLFLGKEIFRKEPKPLAVEDVLRDVTCLVLPRPGDPNLAGNLGRYYPRLVKIFEEGLVDYRRMAQGRGDEFRGHIKGWYDAHGGEQKLVVTGNWAVCKYWRNIRQQNGAGVLNIDISGDIDKRQVFAARVIRTMQVNEGEARPCEKTHIIFDDTGRPKSVQIVKPDNPAIDLKISFSN